MILFFLPSAIQKLFFPYKQQNRTKKEELEANYMKDTYLIIQQKQPKGGEKMPSPTYCILFTMKP